MRWYLSFSQWWKQQEAPNQEPKRFKLNILGSFPLIWFSHSLIIRIWDYTYKKQTAELSSLAHPNRLMLWSARSHDDQTWCNVLSHVSAGDHRQHVLCRLPGGQQGCLQRRQWGAVCSKLQRDLVSDRSRQLGREMRRPGEVWRLHQIRQLPELDPGNHGETGPKRHREPVKPGAECAQFQSCKGLWEKETSA